MGREDGGRERTTEKLGEKRSRGGRRAGIILPSETGAGGVCVRVRERCAWSRDAL